MTDKRCPCGKEIYAKGRCIFHQPPRAKDLGKLWVTWFPVKDDAHYRNVVLKEVWPLIQSKPYHCRAYFINHFGIVDVGFLQQERKHLRNIPRWLKECGLPWLPLAPLPAADYGGAAGVKMCYAALEAFSRLREQALRMHLSLHGESQLMHYWLNQRGMGNWDEAVLHVLVGARRMGVEQVSAKTMRALDARTWTVGQ